jgi:hypothetical protein
MLLKRFLILWMFLCSVEAFCQKEADPSSPEYYARDRQQIRFDDYQVLLFNHRGFVSPRQYSITSFTNVLMQPVNATTYMFNFNFLDHATGKVIRDDVPSIWDKWIHEQKGYDPLAANFRPNTPYMMVTQDEKWQPNAYFRKGTFHKEFGENWISFSINSCTSISSDNDEVFLKIVFRNRKDKPLKLTLIPQQIAKRLKYDGMKGSADSIRQVDPFTLGSEQMRVRVSSDIQNINDKGFEVTLPSNEYVTTYFAVQFYPVNKEAPVIFQKDIKTRMEKADQVTREKLKWAYDGLPKFESSNKKLQEYYYRCLLSVLMCRYENPHFITNPFWSVGIWLFTISWDTSYTSDILAMLDPNSLKEAILTDFREVKMKKTYVSWKGAEWDNLYIQEPFALQIMIEAYLRHTGDYSLLNAKAGILTVWEWMKKWITELQTNYTDSKGLLNIGYDTQKIIEIRTDGYNQVVPIINILTVNLLYRMAEWANLLKDKQGEVYFRNAEKLKDLVNKNLWNEQEGWFDNLYPDGGKEAIWTNHLLDALGTDFLTGNQVNKLAGNIREGVFLGKFGIYSIARKDSVHWDLIDSDWGGGGQYAGNPGRISRNLYKQGFAELAWDILKRHIRYVDYFPYMPQNPRTDSPEEDRSSMPVAISAGAGMEAIIFGLFGIQIEQDHLIISPNTNEDIGHTILRDFRFKGKSYNIEINKLNFSVYENGKIIATKPFGETVKI